MIFKEHVYTVMCKIYATILSRIIVSNNKDQINDHQLEEFYEFQDIN